MRERQTGDRNIYKVIQFIFYVSQVHDIFEAGDKVYFVMELATGGDLLEYIKKHGCVREDKARAIFSQIVEAVRFCHANGVIHRDLKCENVLLDSQHNVMLTDFGFAKFNPRKELCKTFCGSAAYAAYEILKGEIIALMTHLLSCEDF